MHKQTGTTNISQTDDNEPFNKYNDDDWNRADYSIVNIDGIQAFIKKLHFYYNYYLWLDLRKLAFMHTTARHIFYHHMIAIYQLTIQRGLVLRDA